MGNDNWQELIETSAHGAAKRALHRGTKKRKRKKNNNEEQQIQNAILDYLAHRHDVWAFNANSGKVKTAHGSWFQGISKDTADILGFIERDGTAVFLAIEVKRPKPNKTYPTKGQREFIEMVNEAGGVAFVARSVDDVIEGLP